MAFLLAPRDVREDMRAVYRFCRHTDDLGDEGSGSPAERLAALDRWEQQTLETFAGAPGHPVLRPLALAIARRGLTDAPFLALIEANRIDQRQSRFDTYDELLHYCRHSATPVGRMVLGVLGYAGDEWRGGYSDATCIGLQLVNFWQDIARDLRERGRVYLPREDMERFGVGEPDLRRPRASVAVTELIRFQVARARGWFHAGQPLGRLVPPRVALDVRMFNAAGVALCDAIAAQGHDTLRRRPAPGRSGRAMVAVRALLAAVRADTGGRPAAPAA